MFMGGFGSIGKPSGPSFIQSLSAGRQGQASLEQSGFISWIEKSVTNAMGAGYAGHSGKQLSESWAEAEGLNSRRLDTKA